MQVSLHRVALVFDLDFGAALPVLLRSCHVWLVSSLGNSAAAQHMWAQEGNARGSAQAPLLPQLSTFVAQGPTVEDSLATVLGLVEDHHGAFGAGPAVREVLIIGVPSSAAVVATLVDWGYIDQQVLPVGILACQSVSTPR